MVPLSAHAEGLVTRLASMRRTAARYGRSGHSDRELIAPSPSQGAPSEGGSDAATQWNPTGKGFASVRGLPHGSVARPVGGRASRDSGCARLAFDGTARGVVRHRPGPRGRVV